MNTNEISDALREARTTRERLFGELANVRARGLADGTDPAGAVGSLNRDLEAADTRILELEAEYGRAAEIQRMAGDQRHRKPAAMPRATISTATEATAFVVGTRPATRRCGRSSGTRAPSRTRPRLTGSTIWCAATSPAT